MNSLIREFGLTLSVPFYMKNYFNFCLQTSFHRRSFAISDYKIPDGEFAIMIHFDKTEFGHLMNNYVKKIGMSIRENSILRSLGWMCDTIYLSSFHSEYFDECVGLTVKTY